MGWLSGLFSKKKEEPTKQTSTPEPDQIPITVYANLDTVNEAVYAGIDTEFIDFLYFKDETDRAQYINAIEKAVKDLQLSNPMRLTEFREKVHSYDNALPFLLDAMKVKGTSIVIDKNTRKELKRYFQEERYGKSKIGYYDALAIFSYNVEKKIECKDYSFTTNEQWLLSYLTPEHMNYARIEALYLMGRAYEMAGSYEKRDQYFNMILTDNYAISPNTVSEFYRTIAGHYNENGDLHTGLKWLKAGLELNPKLGVKKQVANLEKQLTAG